MCEGCDPVGEQNKDRWINWGLSHSEEDFIIKNHVLYALNKNLPSFMKYKIVYMIYNGS